MLLSYDIAEDARPIGRVMSDLQFGPARRLDTAKVGEILHKVYGVTVNHDVYKIGSKM